MLFRVFLTNEKMFRLLTDPDPDPDLSLPGPGSSFSDPWQLYTYRIWELNINFI